ncbi:siderophore ABC transporter substrate-binding protein [Pukyongiella litopenaei]|uniref:ABC transporter substrate-binding protein n=1 Tax=Pukyongiella litopenaei TaxID=2605946 RepID=A0A2S0MUP1_9RHOB|nr:ABC transporter substrate-binding protein [Pukyongiella litopenaei]AVO39413.1 ABC transporter substrate-binding protein [Pukyongiella litopenaei]
MKFAALLAAALAAAVPVSAAQVTVHSAAGEATVQAPPDRVAVYDIPALDTLQALGVPVGATVRQVYVDYLEPSRASAEMVGTLFEPDYEALHAYGPDLIIVGQRSTGLAGDLTRIGPVMDASFAPDAHLAQVLASFDRYAELFDRAPEAASLKDTLAARIDAARAAVTGAGSALIVMTNGPKISTFGPGSRFGWLHGELGLDPAVTDIADASHGEAISFEYIARADPDWLIVLDRTAAIGQTGQGARDVLDNDLVRGTRAWSAGQVVYLDPAAMYIAAGGHQATMRVLGQIIDAFE